MSDPMTNTEVEDVLASIRRLVSDDNRLEPQEKTTAASDRLVLTPALRVMDDATTPDQEEDALADAHDLADDIDADVEVDATDSADEDAVDDIAHVEEPQVSVSEDEGLDDAVEAGATDTEADPITLDTVDLDQDTLMSIQDAFDEAERNEAAEDTADPEPEQAPDATSLTAKIAALETLIAGQTDEYEPETAGDGDNAGTEPPTLEWEDADEPDAAAPEWVAAEPDAPIEAAPEEAQVFSSDEDVLDEEALRDLVSDIVREELQGALGERITRNVRKLVRREIHRALAAQELE